MSFFSKYPVAVFSLLALICGGCASNSDESGDDFGRIRLRRPDNVVYKEISTAGCELDVPVDLHAVAGTSTIMNVQLINNSSRKLQIQEWYMIDQYNFSIFYRRLPDDRPMDRTTPFQKYSVTIPAQPQPHHAELRLNPGNRAMLTVALPFIEDLAPGETAVFEVYIATSLNTFKIKSKMFMVYTR